MLKSPLHDSVLFVATGFAGFPTFCLLAAAALVLFDRSAVPDDGRTGPVVVAGVILLSSIVAVVMIAAGIVVLPLWSTSAPASAWEPTLSPYVVGAALGSLAVVLADRAMRDPEQPVEVE